MEKYHDGGGRGGPRWTFNGVDYPNRSEMCEARRSEYVRLLDEEGLNFTQAARAVGVSKRTGKVWRNGRTRATGRNEKASVERYQLFLFNCLLRFGGGDVLLDSGVLVL